MIQATLLNTQPFIYTAYQNPKEKTMTNPTAVEVNCTTGEVTERELTDAEMADRAVAAQAAADEQAAREAEDKAKADAKASAMAKLAALGLSADEVAAIL
jgi:hypothetical protein